ncbi:MULTISPECIES: hypothetical protein [Lacrimispora]|jgi:hypothetical protein|uniref:hypothetical protein n=1 Tax=Lacrimispora TaxID=2719231 RepID=UPI000BE4206D|nr:hypothetical protein [Lacrimispora amygdalina]
MKKSKLLTTAILILSLILSTGCSKHTDKVSATSETTSIADSNNTVSAETNNDLEAVGKVDVEKGLFNVELTIPANFVGEQTQEELNKMCEEKGYNSITLNDDGSATYVLTKQQHKEMMEELKNTINSSMSEMVDSEDYPNYTNVTANEDFTEFEITTKSSELAMAETFSVLAFYMYGGMYNVFNGTDIDNITVKFINADTGEVISTTNSKDMEK